jgi:chromosome segregation ATPase
MTSYITRNANLLLLLLIFLIASSLVGATIYFQDRFTNINKQYNDKLAELNNLTVQAKNYQDVLQKAQIELDLKQNREDQFTEKYTEAKATSDALAKEKTDLNAQLTDATGQLASKNSQITSLSNQVSSLNSQVASLGSDNSKLRGDIIVYKDRISCLQNTDDGSEGNC